MSYIYFPLLEETGFVPKQKYTNAPETLEYCKIICEKFNLYENACLQTEVTSTVWNEDTGRWLVKTNLNDEIKARYVVHSNGPLNRPKLPAIKGINSFKGHTFHTSRWDYEYTGGDSHGNLDNLKDKKIAIIGTGATAVQCVPHLGSGAEQLYVFQRTPSSIDVRNNQPTDPDWISTQKEGWHDSKAFLKGLERRQQTLLLVSEYLIEAQENFLNGESGKRALSNKEIAEKLNISPSTVSRIVRNKYLQLPDKVIQLRELLEKRINKLNSGRDVTTEDLKFLLEQMVLNEDDSNPLSDENIKSALEENFEVYVSRRTIAKYRLELDIPSSKQRYLR